MSLRKKRLAQLKYKAENRIAKSGNVIVSSPDSPLMIIILILIAFGSMAIFSAGAPEGLDLYKNPAYYLIKHISFLVLGFAALIFATKFDYKKWKELAIPFTFITIGLIAATYVPGIGRESYGASRWLAGLPIQPSELAKPACVILISAALTESKNIFNKKMLTHLGLVLLMIALILQQPNLSISLIISMITAALLLLGGMSFNLMAIGGIGAGIFVYNHILSTQYQLARITGWLHPWRDQQGAGYNLIQSWYAIASGGIFGVGLGESKQKLFWLPFRHTDFIFAVIGEELGLLGCIALIGLFMAFIYRGFLIADRCENYFGKLVASGITFAIGVQAFVNIGVATGVLPATGVTLPLISYGGSSLVVTLLMLGILLNISRKRIKKIQTNEQGV